jgi:hydrogenase expression/formation protein HypE
MGKLVDLDKGRVEMVHGAGGRASAELIESLFAPAFDNPYLGQRNDGARLAPPPGEIVFSTDTYVVSPLFFPGGDIGRLAVHGTINDIAMGGARPLWLSAGFVLEEGYPLADLARIVRSMGEAARAAGVCIVTGDTKVVERGKGDGVFVNTAGLGVIPAGITPPSGDRAQPGDAILVSGTLGDHGVAILSCREHLELAAGVESDTAPLHGLVAALLDAGIALHALRDPTRGGLGTTLNEIARQSGVGMVVKERAVPVRPAVAAACEILGIDPLYVANEGKLVAFCPKEEAPRALAVMRAHPVGREARIIGEVVADPRKLVLLETPFGGKRILDWLAGEQLPRIC